MVAKVRCEEIATEKLEELRANEAWRMLEEQSASALNPLFGSQATALINACSSGDDHLLTALSLPLHVRPPLSGGRGSRQGRVYVSQVTTRKQGILRGGSGRASRRRSSPAPTMS